MSKESKYNSTPGSVYGDLEIVELLPPRKVGNSTRRFLLCRCKCGLVREYIANNVFAGNSSNCGCWRRDPQKNNNSKKAYGEAAFNHVFYGYKKNAERRNLSFTLTTEEFLSFCSQPCHYCGRVKVSVASIKHAKGDRAGQLRLNGEFGYNGIDRMDNKVGYELTNCVSCCVDCNFAKTSHDYLDFLMMIKRIYENMNLEKI